MLVRGDRPPAKLDFSAGEIRIDELACILENRLLQDAMWQTAQGCDMIEVIAPAEPTALKLDDDAARLTLADGRVLSAPLVVGADGANPGQDVHLLGSGIQANPRVAAGVADGPARRRDPARDLR